MSILDENYATDLKELSNLLDKEGIKHTFLPHPGYKEEVVRLIGHSPTGIFQIRTHDGYSIIRGTVSFGDYEIYNSEKMDDPERTVTAEEMVKLYKKLSK